MCSLRLALSLVIALFAVAASLARPPHKQAVAAHLGEFLPPRLNVCVLCHLPDKSGVDAKPHNAFGVRLKALGEELARAGKPNDLASRFNAAADEDSDGDGTPNLIEILTNHFPGDPKDQPTAEEVTAARRTLVALQKFQSRYPWRPYDVVKRPQLPVVKNPAWTRNPVDRFIAAEHESRGLRPRPEADKGTLLRRIHLDLTGLMPTPQELHAFLNDSTPGAFERVVDKLLDSPRYGERWGRHWMDVWRYSDWAGWEGGGQIRDSQPHIWRWRDWIIESLNEDKGYDRMIVEMLAGDEVAPEDPKTLRATGFLVRNYKMLSREKWLQDTVDHTFLAFQATTIGCARCHDHMYDPILQKEYYQIRAVFAPHQVRIDRLPGQPDIKKDGLPRVYDADLNVPTFLLIRGDDRTPDKTALGPAVPAALGGRLVTARVALPRDAYIPDRRAFVERETIAAAEAAVVRATETWTAARQTAASFAGAPWYAWPRKYKADHAAALAEINANLAQVQHAALVAILDAERLEQSGKKSSDEWKKCATAATLAQRRVALAEAKRSLLLAQTEKQAAKSKPMTDAAEMKITAARKQIETAEAAVKAPSSTAYTPRALPTFPAESSGRRLGLAKWLSDVNNPLTARVAVNHIWMRHFGQAIVPSVFDFGRNGRAPTNPALLDWLAAEFMAPDQGTAWSMKRLHRLLVTSATYRMASTPDESNIAIDRDNTYLWRMPPRRLEAELVRDNVLHVAGKLDLAMSGPDIDHNTGMAVFRRSVYFRHAAEKQMEFLKLFDAANVTECYQRKDSIIPQQALALANSELAIRMARLLARDLTKSFADPAAYVTALFERTLTRPPTSAEMTECLAFLEDQQAQTAPNAAAIDVEGKRPAPDSSLRARESLASVLLNHHEFVTVR